VHESGSLVDGEKLSASVLDLTYLNSYVAHAPMETHSAVARMEGGKVTVWASTQTPFPLQQQVAQALAMPKEDVRVIAPYVGGGFGGKSASRQAIEAARLAKIVGRPVQVVTSRAEEFFYDAFRPAAVVKIRSGLTADGRIGFWDYQVCGAGEREAALFYPTSSTSARSRPAGGWAGILQACIRSRWGRGVRPRSTPTPSRANRRSTCWPPGPGADPLEFRLSQLSNQRMRRALEAVAKQFGWRAGRAPSGRGVGVACGIYSGTLVATMAEVVADKSTGHVQVKRVVSAQDQGLTVNPDGSRQQMEGCIVMGLGYALSEEVRFKDGEVLDRNFDTYRTPRFSWLPKIETVLIENRESPPSSGGEPAIITMGAVVANAIYDALGARVLQLPMTPARVLEALAKGVSDASRAVRDRRAAIGTARTSHPAEYCRLYLCRAHT